MNRYGRAPWFEPSQLSVEQRAYYDELVAGPRHRDMIMDADGRLLGAFNARLLNPAVGTAIQRLGAALRFGDVLAPREREIAILEVARAMRCSYEWNAHARSGRTAGLTDAELAALLAGGPVATLSPAEAVVRETAATLCTHGDLSDEQFAAAESTLGLSKLFTIVSIVGHYTHTALAMRVWRVPLRDGDPDVFA